MQDHFRLWSDTQISAGELITAAQYVWTSRPPEETHFSSHHYQISTYQFCPDRQRYLLVDRFLTRKKFDGLDLEDHPWDKVLSVMIAQVKIRLSRQKAAGKQTCTK
jgi:hypothetical protein